MSERNKQEQRRIDLHTKLTLLNMDFTAMVMTGEKTGMYESYSSQESEVRIQNKSEEHTPLTPRERGRKGRKKKKALTKAEMKKAIERENAMIANLSVHLGGGKKK